MTQTDEPGEPLDADRTMLLAREQLTVTTRSVPVGRVRLERYQVTETRTVTVDVLVDRLRIVTIKDGQQPQVIDDPPATDGAPTATSAVGGEQWLVLSEEQVVVTKHRVPVERVQLQTVVLTQDRTVTDLVRVERVELDSLQTPDNAPPT